MALDFGTVWAGFGVGFTFSPALGPSVRRRG